MKKFVSALLAAAVLLLAPAGIEPAHKDRNYLAYVRWAGCSATLATSDEHSVLASSYDMVNNILYIGTARDEVPADLALMVLFHEVGHCLQNELGYLSPYVYMVDPVPFELDADRWAADLACSLGMDGGKLLHNLFIWAQEKYGYEGDPWHGSLEQRIRQANEASLCVPVGAQVPLQA